MTYGASRVNEAFWVEIALMIAKLETYSQHQLVTLCETFDFRQLQLSTEGVRYKSINAEKIIFCEGFRAGENPLFRFIPFRPVKGEVLILKVPGLAEDYILNKDVFVLPLGQGLFKVGATYDWSDLGASATTKAKETLMDKLGKFLELPYVVLSQEAGIRPAIADRRPVAGFHPLHKNVLIFNGLGAKGAMLAPFFAQELVRLITEGIGMNPAVDPIRFTRTLNP
ncbi:MAG: FAD-dependent oxidoreductase [Bacteroidales bacterium]|nr:FAD-dependent oxidoreductase [Bacteroidales bacterium]